MSKLSAALLIALDAGDFNETQHAISVLANECRTYDGGKESVAEVAARLLGEAYEKAQEQLHEMNQHVTRHMLAVKHAEEKIADLQAELNHLRKYASPNEPSVPLPANPRYVVRKYGTKGQWGIVDRLTLSWKEVLNNRKEAEAVFFAYRSIEMPEHCSPYSTIRETHTRKLNP